MSNPFYTDSRGLLNKVWDWFDQPVTSDTNPTDWLAGVAVLMILAFLWSRVLKQVVSDI